ncbi:hypothetical protein [Labedaea rhizosphaerae]|uniref:Uncharacterized protein n=1 Tax=Labedaea rhizosphaerae TaxID=598644 RepID=A0A4V3D0C3_LABRH|nr:hypothetical protein [Labedaea rhizosphaerae]TDQ05225.1 hypothetical protein EV186_1011193 [Labedaea rhizosphaerae]
MTAAEEPDAEEPDAEEPDAEEPDLVRAVRAARFAATLGIGVGLLIDAFVAFTRSWDLETAPWAVVPVLSVGWTLALLADHRQRCQDPAERRVPSPAGVLLYVSGKLWPIAVCTLVTIGAWNWVVAAGSFVSGVFCAAIWWPRQARMDRVLSGERRSAFATERPAAKVSRK